MGWASGTYTAEIFADLILEYVPKDKILKEARKALSHLTDMDWDCINEVNLFLLVDMIDNKDEYLEFHNGESEYLKELKELKLKLNQYRNLKKG